MLVSMKCLYDYPSSHNVIIGLVTRNTFSFNASKTPVKFLASYTNTHEIFNRKTRRMKRIGKYICNVGRACITVGKAGRIGGDVEIFDIWG